MFNYFERLTEPFPETPVQQPPGSRLLRLKSLSQFIMWEIAGLFRNIGTVQDGLNTLSRPQAVRDAPEARQLQIRGGGIRFELLALNGRYAQLWRHQRGGFLGTT
ncbi:hypothetical protein [Marinobacterium aestuariivivens]|uniref:Uncharacterized protein n=1 Tax=Marinobacterium aestuariivivens TaxID=1698799 RepID=A0ABW1ZXI2_9GAMM